MKKIITTVTLALLAAPVTSVVAGSGPGCGWGQMVWKGQSGLSAHTAAATTNGTSMNQWFGITSGTAGCSDKAVVQNDAERRMFVADNLDSLAQDIAQGGGEHLAVLASLMGVVKGDEAAFFHVAQSHYGALFSSTETNGSQMLSALDGAMVSDASLAKYVR